MTHIINRIAAATALMAAAIAAVPFGAAAATSATCYACSPQCVPAARTWSGVNFPRVEFAKDIPAAARKANFEVTSTPSLGRKSAAVIALGAVDHVVAITKASTSAKAINLTISHANYDCKCSTETASATFSNGKITFTSGALKGRAIAVRAFISNPK